jgi:ketosteroid isomerase-like protein
MSEENVGIVRRVYEAAARRDSTTVLALYDPDVEVDNTHGPGRAVIGGESVFHGHEGLRTFYREWNAAWEKIEEDYEELIDAGDHVIGVVTSRGRGRASGIDVELTQYGVWTIREDKIVRMAFFPSREEALEAAGLAE